MLKKENHKDFIKEQAYFGFKASLTDFIGFSFFSHSFPITNYPFINRFLDISAFNFFCDANLKHIPASEYKTLTDNFIYYGTHQSAKFLTLLETQTYLKKISPNNIIMHNILSTFLARTAFFTVGELANNISEDFYKWAFNISILSLAYTFKTTSLPHHKIIAGLICGWLVNDIIHYNFLDTGKAEGISCQGIVTMLYTSSLLSQISGESSKSGIETMAYLEENIPAWLNGIFPHLNHQFTHSADAATTLLGKIIAFTTGKAAAPYIADAIMQTNHDLVNPVLETANNYIINSTNEYAFNMLEYSLNKSQELSEYLGWSNPEIINDEL